MPPCSTCRSAPPGGFLFVYSSTARALKSACRWQAGRCNKILICRSLLWLDAQGTSGIGCNLAKARVEQGWQKIKGGAERQPPVLFGPAAARQGRSVPEGGLAPSRGRGTVGRFTFLPFALHPGIATGGCLPLKSFRFFLRLATRTGKPRRLASAGRPVRAFQAFFSQSSGRAAVP